MIERDARTQIEPGYVLENAKEPSPDLPRTVAIDGGNAAPREQIQDKFNVFTFQVTFVSPASQTVDPSSISSRLYPGLQLL
jgi:hypothetical protein